VVWHADKAPKKDPRDLWTAVVPLVAALRPVLVYGEQVAGGKARPWCTRAEASLQKCGYSFASEERRASDFGAPSKRKRFYFSAKLKRARSNGLVKGLGVSASRPWRWRGQEDLRAIAQAPFKQTNRWPQPLVRSGDAGISNRMATIRAYGNAIDPWVAAQFIVDSQNPR